MSFTIKSFEDYLERANRCETAEELFEVYLDAVKSHGLDRAIFSLMSDHQDIGEKAGFGVIRNYPEDWLSYYFEKRLDEIDPVPIYAVNKMEAFYWKDICKDMKLTKAQEEVLSAGAEAGLNNGIGICFRGIRNQIAGIALASSEKKDNFDGRIDLITAYSNHFYSRYRQLKKTEHVPILPINLTRREKEVLTWAAHGKSNADIASILNLSAHTVDFHMRNIFNKLEAPSRIVAVVKAISLGLIAP